MGGKKKKKDKVSYAVNKPNNCMLMLGDTFRSRIRELRIPLESPGLFVLGSHGERWSKVRH